MTRVRMLTGTYDGYHGLLRRGDEKNVPQDTAERWAKNRIAIIIEQEVAADPITKKEKVGSKKNRVIPSMVHEEEDLKTPDADPIEIDVEKMKDYSTMTRDELIAIAKGRGITVTKAMKTETIIKKLEG